MLAAEKALNSKLAKVRAALMQTNTELAQQQALSADLALQQLDLSNAPGASLSSSAFARCRKCCAGGSARQPAHGQTHCPDL